MKFVAGKGRGKSFAKCDDIIVLKVSPGGKIYESEKYGKSLRVDAHEVNDESIVAFSKKLSKAVDKFFGEKVEIDVEKLFTFIKLKGQQMMNNSALYDDNDDKPAEDGLPYSALTTMDFDRIKGTISTYSFEGRKGVYFTALEFFTD